MKRTDVKIEYKWKLEDIYPGLADWEREFSELNKEIVKVLKFKGRLSDKNMLIECLKFNDAVNLKLEKLYCYAMFLKDQNGTDNKANEVRSRAETLLVQFGSMSSFISPEISAMDETALNSFINDPDFATYDYMLSEVIRGKKHILSEKEENLLALGGKTFGAFHDIFANLDDIDLPLPYIKAEGKREKLTHGKYSLFLQSPDSSVRKKAFKGMYGAIISMINTITATYSSEVNKNNFLAKVRNYDSALDKAVTSRNIPADVVTNLIKETAKNLTFVHDYIALRKKVIGAEVLHMYDLYFPIFENADIKCNYEKAYDMVLEGLKPMGQEYLGLLKQAKDSRWIDVEETENKRSGAYSCGVAGVHPYVLLNYHETTHDIFTIAHEMGHALHSYYSSSSQPYAKADYAIFVAEVASTVNEVMLLKYLIKTVSDKNVKKYLLSYYLDMFRTTMFRQTMFAEFEAKAHAAEAASKPLTVESLSKIYLDLNKKYYGPAVKHDKEIRYEWARIPHFYRAFYVYQYATGIASAVNIVKTILSEGEGAVTRYKKFLCAGGSKSPYEILKDCGVDLLTSNPYDVAFGEFRDTLEELKKLCD